MADNVVEQIHEIVSNKLRDSSYEEIKELIKKGDYECALEKMDIVIECLFLSIASAFSVKGGIMEVISEYGTAIECYHSAAIYTPLEYKGISDHFLAKIMEVYNKEVSCNEENR